MSSPLGPTVANLFLCHHETKGLTNRPLEFIPAFYKRYIDDAGFGMKCDSFLPYQFKFNLISCLIKRAFEIGSKKTAFNAELSYLQKYFTQNNFPANLVSKMFQKVIHKIYNPKPKCLC